MSISKRGWTTNPPHKAQILRFLRKTAASSLMAATLMFLTLDARLGIPFRADRTNEPQSHAGGEVHLSVGSAHAQEGGGGLSFGTGLSIAGAAGSLIGDLYYAFDSSYIDKFYGGNVTGYFLTLLTGTSRTTVELDYVIDQLSAIEHQLNHLISLAKAIEAEIAALEQEIKWETSVIEAHIEAAGMAHAENEIENYTENGRLLTKYRNKRPKDITAEDRAYIVRTCGNIVQAQNGGLNPNNNQSNWLNTINTGLTYVGPNNTGLIQLLAKQARLRIEAGTHPYDAYTTMETYFLRYFLLQTKGINLYVECAHVTPDPLTHIPEESIKANYLAYLKPIVEQFQQFRDAVESVVLNAGYDHIRNDFGLKRASTTPLSFYQPTNDLSVNILPRLDYVIDQALGGTDLETLANNNPAAFLKRPRGTLTARVLAKGSQYPKGYPLTFTPFVPDCPEGFKRSAVWKIANGSTDALTIAYLGAWSQNGNYEEFTPQQLLGAEPPIYGSALYQIAAAPLTLNPQETGYVRLCANPNKNNDVSLYLKYRQTPANATKQSSLSVMQWSGSLLIDQNDPSFFFDNEAKTVTIGPSKDCAQCRPSYSAAYTGKPSALAGLPFMQWNDESIIGNSSSYQMLRYGFPNAPLGSYAVTGGPTEKDPTVKDLLAPWFMDVFRYDRQFTKIDGPQNLVLADSQTRRAWESFVLEDYRLSKTSDSALGKLRAANGKYAAVDQKGQLVADSDTGHDVAFVGWTKDMGSNIVNWGYLQFGDAGYAKIEVKDPSTGSWSSAACPPAVETSPWPQTRTTFVKNIKDGTKFKVTFIDKGKTALKPGQDYEINLAYGIACDQSKIMCTSLIEPSGRCHQYYLYANIGYPYGYFTYSPVAAAGGLGKSLSAGPGVSPFASWSYGGNDYADCSGAPNGSASQTTHKGETIIAKILPSHKSAPTYACAAPLSYAQTRFGVTGNKCKYHFSLKMVASAAWDVNWNDADHDDLKQVESYLQVGRVTDDDLIYTPQGTKSFSDGQVNTNYIIKNISYSSGDSAYVRYAAKLDYSAGPLAPWWNDAPTATMEVTPLYLHLNLEKIDCPAD